MGAAKLALRDQLLTARQATPAGRRSASGRGPWPTTSLAAPEVRRPPPSRPTSRSRSEPGTGPLLDALTRAGKRVILPLVQPDKDLDWAVYAGPTALHSARFGLLEPDGPPLGLDAIRGADAVLVPGLAVGRDGMRLGRGAGCYDRVLERVPPGTFVCLLLNSEEVLDSVPHEDHDRAVSAVATEDGIHRFARR